MLRDICVVDIETARSARDVEGGWENLPALGISIGGYFSYERQQILWFDANSVRDVIVSFAAKKPLLISFNGLRLDFPLMRTVARMHGMSPDDPALRAFEALAAESYDILAAIWEADPEGQHVRGLNSLDAILRAEGMPPKCGSGDEAPRWWGNQHYAKVLNYCQHDILSTRALFERLIATHSIVQRHNGPLALQRYPNPVREIITRPMEGT